MEFYTNIVASTIKCMCINSLARLQPGTYSNHRNNHGIGLTQSNTASLGLE